MSKIIKVDCGIHFRLREPKASSQTPVVCFIEYNGKPAIKIATGLKIKPAEWNFEKEKPLTGLRGLKSTQAHLFNARISAIRHTVETLFREYIMKYSDYPDKAQFKKDVLRELFGESDDKTVIVKDPCFLNFISGQIVQAKSGNRVKLSGNGKGARFANDTIKDYTVVLNLLQRFLVYIGKSSISFDEITLEFYRQLQQYMYEEMEYSLNYFGKIVKSIKAFMREAQELGYHNNETYKSNRFIKPQEETDAIYLNTDQLETILQLDLSKSKSLENARDLFLVGCWTGLRFSDFSELSNRDVIKGDFIHIKTQKTGASVAIPILPPLKEIMNRYKDQTENGLPHSISNQKLNAYIKEIGKIAGFDQIVEVTKPTAGSRKTIKVPFYQLITTHTARRSFATNMYRIYKLPPATIMKVTGHKSEAVFFKYIRITPEENAQMILDAVMRKHNSLV